MNLERYNQSSHRYREPLVLVELEVLMCRWVGLAKFLVLDSFGTHVDTSPVYYRTVTPPGRQCVLFVGVFR